MLKQVSWIGLCCLTALSLAACGGDNGVTIVDGGTDMTVIDLGGRDGGGEGGVDMGPRDAGPDLGRCITGRACDPARGCATGTCIAETAGTLGSATDPIYTESADGGLAPSDPAMMYPSTFMAGGYCSNTDFSTAASREGQPGACDPNAPAGMDGCEAGCGRCTSLGQDAMGLNVVICMASCEPSQTAGSSCRAGYECSPTDRVCQGGCQSDAECRIIRPDTNGDGEINSSGAAADHLVYDSTSAATCNTTTFRCDSPGTEGATSGDTCTRNSECEENGVCINPIFWDGGYCSKFGCDVAGRECDGAGSVCFDIGIMACLHACKVGAEATEENPLPTGVDAHGDTCRPGYSCAWDLVTDATEATNGACVPGTYNAVAENNIGAHCQDIPGGLTADEQCWSPFGIGRCIFDTPTGGFCSLINCGAPGMPENICGENATCVSVSSTDATTACFSTCTVADDCQAGFACVDLDGTGAGTLKSCLANCQAPGECRAGQSCTIPTGETFGTCTGGST